MDVQEIAPGLWRWTGFHEEWKQDVGCVYLEAPDAICLIDPLVPPEDSETFFRALDRDVERAGRPVHVLVTVFWHTRSAGELAARYDAEVWAPSRARQAVERRAGQRARVPSRRRAAGRRRGVRDREVERGRPLPAGAPDARGRRRDPRRAQPERRPRLCPDSWLPGDVGQEELRESLQPLLDLDVERLLVSHGEPVLESGGAALAGSRLTGRPANGRPARPDVVYVTLKNPNIELSCGMQ